MTYTIGYVVGDIINFDIRKSGLSNIVVLVGCKTFSLIIE